MIHINDLRSVKPSVETSIELASMVFFDIETSGLRPDRGAKITEVAILNRNDRQLAWQSRKNSEAGTVHSQLPEILKLLKTGIVVGHNLSFDFWFISYEANRLGLEGPDIQFIDTLGLARKILDERSSYQLEKLLKEFRIKIDGELHTAIVDAEATRALFWKLIEMGEISTVGEAGIKQLYWSSI